MSVLLARYLYFPLAEAWRGTPVSRYLREFQESQWFSEEALRARTARSLAETLEAAWNVPYYRRRLAGFPPIDPTKAFEALEQIPVLSKEETLRCSRELRSGERLGRIYSGRRSDSSGESLEYFFTAEFLARTQAAQWRGRGWWGMRRGDPMLALVGAPVGDKGDGCRVRRRDRLRNWLPLPAFDLSHGGLRSLYGLIERFRPEYIYGRGSAIYQLALLISEHALPAPPSLRAVFFSAEPPGDLQRRMVEETLRVPTAREYGRCETGAFAFECREGGIHAAAENVHVEILRDGRPAPPGEGGEVVVTVLRNRAMPLIRYGLGDRARWLMGRCACGRSLPRLELLEAKEEEPPEKSGACEVSERLFDSILMELIDRGMRGIRGFQVVQKTIDRFLVQVMTGPGSVPDCLDLFERRMREQIGGEITVEFEIVPQIPCDPSGKIRCFRSEVGPRGGEEPCERPSGKSRVQAPQRSG